jgi:hypothetical protein
LFVLFVTGAEMTDLSGKLRYDREVIRVWFCNKRQGLKNTIKKFKTPEQPYSVLKVYESEGISDSNVTDNEMQMTGSEDGTNIKFKHIQFQNDSPTISG